MAAVYGWQGQLGIDTANPVTKRYNFISSDIALEETIYNNSGDSATPEEIASRTRLNTRSADGPLVMEPTAVEWYAMLEWILGGPGVSTNIPLTNAIASRYVVIDDTVKVPVWSSCVVGRATISSQEKSALKLDMQIFGTDETLGAAATFPALTYDTTSGPYMHFDGAFVINSVTVRPKAWSLVIDNMPDTERYLNSQTRISTPRKGRRFTWNFNLPYGDYVASYGLQAADVAASATFTVGNTSLIFASSNIRFPRQGAKGRGREEEIMLVPNGIAYKPVGSEALVVTCDNTI